MDSHGWRPWRLRVVLRVDLWGRGVWIARCLRIGGTPVRLWGWGGLIIEGVLVFFFSPVGERSLFRMTVAITMQQMLSEQHCSQANPGSFLFTRAPFRGLHCTAEKTEADEVSSPRSYNLSHDQGHKLCFQTQVLTTASYHGHTGEITLPPAMPTPSQTSLGLGVENSRWAMWISSLPKTPSITTHTWHTSPLAQETLSLNPALSPHRDGVLGLLGSQAPLWAGVRLPSCRGVCEP